MPRNPGGKQCQKKEMEEIKRWWLAVPSVADGKG